MKLSSSRLLNSIALLTIFCAPLLTGCQDKGNEPVKDGKTITSDKEAMRKMYQGGAGAPGGAAGGK